MDAMGPRCRNYIERIARISSRAIMFVVYYPLIDTEIEYLCVERVCAWLTW